MINKINPTLSLKLNDTLSNLESEVKKLKHISDIYNEIIELKDKLTELKSEQIESSKLISENISSNLSLYENLLNRMSSEHELMKNVVLSSIDSDINLKGVSIDLVSMNDIDIHVHKLLELNNQILDNIQNYNLDLKLSIKEFSTNIKSTENLLKINEDLLKINKVNNDFTIELLRKYEKISDENNQKYEKIISIIKSDYIDIKNDIFSELKKQREKIEDQKEHITLLENNLRSFHYRQNNETIKYFNKNKKINLIINIILYLSLLALILFK